MNKWIRLVITELIILMIGIGVLFTLIIVLPAYASTRHGVGESTIFDWMMIPGGTYNPKTDEIIIFHEPNTTEYNLTMKHELCHKKQKDEGRLRNDFLGNFLNELECQIAGFS